MIKAVLWDLGNVLCGFTPDRRVREIARCSGASEDDVRALLNEELLARLDAGDMTADQLTAVVAAELGWPCTGAELGRAWIAAFVPNPSVVDLARRLVVPTAVLTNNGPPLSDGYATLLAVVAQVVPIALFSGQTRVMKPDAAAFLNACELLDALAAEVLLVDDSAANISAASRAGIHTHRYQNPEMLEMFLDRHQLLGPRSETMV